MPRYEAPAIDDSRIWDLFLTQAFQASVVTADELGVFTALAENPGTIRETATRLDFDERATGILLRLLASLHFLVPRDGTFHLTERTRLYLLPSSPFYWGPMLRVGVNEKQRATLVEVLKQKGSAERSGPEGVPKSAASGKASDGWAEGNISADQAGQIAARMHAHSLVSAIGAARAYDFSGVRRLLDVGGGSGCFTIAIAQQYPTLRGTIMELPTMCTVARGYIEDGGVKDRVDTLAVDMFRQPWPRDYDAVFFSNIWHDWNFTTCAALARRAYEILPSGGRILLHEMLLDDDGAGPPTAAGFSMLMLLATQGQQFTFGELKGLLEGAGFTRIASMPTSAYYSVTTGFKP